MRYYVSFPKNVIPFICTIQEIKVTSKNNIFFQQFYKYLKYSLFFSSIRLTIQVIPESTMPSRFDASRGNGWASGPSGRVGFYFLQSCYRYAVWQESLQRIQYCRSVFYEGPLTTLQRLHILLETNGLFVVLFFQVWSIM